MQFTATITAKSINIFLDGRMRTIPKEQINADKIEKLIRQINELENAPPSFRDALRNRETAIKKRMNQLREILDLPTYIEKMSAGRVRVTDKGVMFNDAPLNNTITDQLMKLLKAGQDVGPLAHFLDRLMRNPTVGVREDLYAWIESGSLALSPDGCFLAFKKVASDYSSIHRGPNGEKVDNSPGQKPSMPREQVDDNRDATCSQGLHFCSFQYLPNFGWGGEDKVVILKVAPEDVVAIPTDYNRSKGRAWTYEVLGEVPEEECEGLFNERVVFGAEFGDPVAEVPAELGLHFDIESYDDLTKQPVIVASVNPTNDPEAREAILQQEYDDGYYKGYDHGRSGARRWYTEDDLCGQDDDAYYKGYIDGHEAGVKSIYG